MYLIRIKIFYNKKELYFGPYLLKEKNKYSVFANIVNFVNTREILL